MFNLPFKAAEESKEIGKSIVCVFTKKKRRLPL